MTEGIEATESQRQALLKGRKRSAPKVLEIHEAIRIQGEHELGRPITALWVSGLAAGLSMGFSFLAEATLKQALPEVAWSPLISKLGYCVGFLIVILGRQQLFTENTLTPILALFSKPSWKQLLILLRLWLVVLLANLCGATLFAGFLARTPAFSSESQAIFAELAAHAMEIGPLPVFLRGILGGCLIALIVWLIPSAESAKITVIVILTYLVGVSELSHVVAGSCEVLYGVWAGFTPLPLALGDYILPALAGNVLGGVTLVSILHHAQVRLDFKHETIEDEQASQPETKSSILAVQ